MAKPDLTNPDNKILREFGFIMAGAIGGIFGALLPWLFDRPWPMWPWPVAGLFLLCGLAFPSVLKHVFVLWMKFGHLLSRVTTPLILGILFYLVITPFGLVRRVFAKDSMRRSTESDATSYREASNQPDDEHMERPF